MQGSRLVKVLEQLNSREKELFRQFVISPYFNQHQKTIALLTLIFDELDKIHPNLQKEKVFKKLFPKETYEEQKLQNTMSYLMRLYHRFLAIQNFEEQEIVEQLHIVQKAFKINNLEVFTNRSKLLEKNLQKHTQRDSTYYLVQYQYQDLLREYTINYVSRTDQTTGQSTMDHLDYFYISEKLKYGALLITHQMIANIEYRFDLLDEIMKYVSDNFEIYAEHPTIVGYYMAIRIIKEDDSEQAYQKLKNLLQESATSIHQADLSELYNFASNYCVRRINIGDKIYEQELLNIYKQAVESGSLLKEGKIDSWVYKNIATLGCHLKDYEWTKNFIEDYKEKISDKNKENVYKYSLAYYYLSTKNHKEAQSLLQEVEFTETQYHLGGNLLLIRTYYEQENYDSLSSLLESMRIYIMRSKRMNANEKKGYKNFIRYAKKMVQLTIEAPYMTNVELEKKLLELVIKLRATENIYAQSWIISKCEEMQRKAKPQRQTR